MFFAVFFLTHYVSLGSLSAYVTAFLGMILRGEGGAYGMDKSHMMEMYILMAALTLLAFYKHRSNIVRLIHGNENRIYPHEETVASCRLSCNTALYKNER